MTTPRLVNTRADIASNGRRYEEKIDGLIAIGRPTVDSKLWSSPRAPGWNSPDRPRARPRQLSDAARDATMVRVCREM